MDNSASRTARPATSSTRGLTPSPLRVAVIGAGAIGKTYSALLHRASNEERKVELISRRRAAKDELAEGITVTDLRGATWTERPRVRSYHEFLEAGTTCDIALLAIAAYDNQEVLRGLAGASRSNPTVLSLQNGVEVLPELLRHFDAASAIQGATTFAATSDGVQGVRISSHGETWLPKSGAISPELVAWMGDATLNPVVEGDSASVVWKKAALATAGYVCRVLGVGVGRAVGAEEVRDVCQRASLEIVRIAGEEGVEVDAREVLLEQERIWKRLEPDADSSLLTSYVSGRRSELDDRLGALVRKARSLEVQVPVLATMHSLCRSQDVLSATEHPNKET